MPTKTITRSAAAVALGFLCSQIKLFHLPYGGSITLCSMLFISLPGYWFGLKIGVISGIIFGLLKFMFDPVFVHPIQFFLDNILAFACFGLSGIFKSQKNSLIKGFVLVVFLRFLCAFISGIVFFGSYAHENGMPAVIYSLIYNLSYIGSEAVITLILICIPSFKNMLEYFR